MSVQVKISVKKSSNFRQLVEEFQREVIEGTVHKAVDSSVVDTAAYVDSFGFNNPSGFSSKGRVRGQDGNAAKARNKQRLSQEVASLNLSGPIVFGNSAPHAGYVEDRHKVFAQARREFRRIARDALTKVSSK